MWWAYNYKNTWRKAVSDYQRRQDQYNSFWKKISEEVKNQ